MAGRSASSAIGEVNELRRRLKEIRRIAGLRINSGASKALLLGEIELVAEGHRDEELFIEAQSKRKETK